MGNLSEPKYDLRAQYNVWVPMRDGVRLSADVYRPDQEGKYPVLLLRTYYGKCNRDLGEADLKEFIFYFVTRGYVVVVQDCRGRYDSEGEFYIEIYDFEDGLDLIAIEAPGLASWEDLDIQQDGDDVGIFYGSSGIYVVDADVSDFSAQDFVIT